MSKLEELLEPWRCHPKPGEPMKKWHWGIHINRQGIYWIGVKIGRKFIPDGILAFQPLPKSSYDKASELGCADFKRDNNHPLKWNGIGWVCLDFFPCGNTCFGCSNHAVYDRVMVASSNMEVERA
jgi:hypothetical protein